MRAGSAIEPGAACAQRRSRRVAAEVRAGREEKHSCLGSLTRAQDPGPPSVRARPQGPPRPLRDSRGPGRSLHLDSHTAGRVLGPESDLGPALPPWAAPCRGSRAPPEPVELEGSGGVTEAGAAFQLHPRLPRPRLSSLAANFSVP